VAQGARISRRFTRVDLDHGDRLALRTEGVAAQLRFLRRSAREFHAGGAAGAESFAVEERSEWLAQGLATLPFEQRATLELAYFVGHSCEEIASIMDCPVNTVKARMFQARIKLRNLLPKLGGFADAKHLGGSQL
jgi:DNA-directed RNA polymerase specialized sigma24 family protein